jgi:hypothetical protein
MDNGYTEREIQLAAKAWCGPTTRYIVMDIELAQEFAKILGEYREELKSCWSVCDARQERY